jgi:hypothetical protein
MAVRWPRAGKPRAAAAWRDPGHATRPSINRSTLGEQRQGDEHAAGATTRGQPKSSRKAALPENAAAARPCSPRAALKITKLTAWKSGASRRWTSQSVRSDGRRAPSRGGASQRPLVGNVADPARSRGRRPDGRSATPAARTATMRAASRLPRGRPGGHPPAAGTGSGAMGVERCRRSVRPGGPSREVAERKPHDDRPYEANRRSRRLPGSR